MNASDETLTRLLDVTDPDGRTGLLIAANGREHELAFLNVENGLLYARIANYLRVYLYQPNPRQPALILRLGTIADVQRECYEAGRTVLVDQPVFIKTAHHFVANVSEISGIELLDYPYLKADPHKDGKLDEAMLLEAVPQLQMYYSPEGGFSNRVAEPMSIIPPSSIIPVRERIVEPS
jgi:hypothetical protein